MNQVVVHANMALLFVNPGIPSGRLQLSLYNLDGYSQDVFNIGYTIFKQDGTQVSGRNISAIRVDTGKYEASWACSDIGGCYKIKWEYKSESGLPIEVICNDFFVVSSSYYQSYLADVISGQSLNGICKAFYCGQVLRDGDLNIYLKDVDGFPVNAYAVFWSIIDCCTGCPLVNRTEATPGLKIGSYYANWFVNLTGGEYKIKWEWMETADSPLESACMTFSIICNDLFNISGECVTSDSFCVSPDGLDVCCIIRKIYVPVSSPCSPVGPGIPVMPMVDQCCPFEIPRVVHLLEQNLPINGAFTNQSVYTIPSRIRKIMFYVTYQRNLAGGYGLFRLLWGNGTEETQSTMVDLDFTGVDTARSQQDSYMNDFKGPEPTTNNCINFSFETNVPGGATTVRLLVAEGGQVAAPGIISITLTAASD